jgi:hypothetical protein
MVQRLFISLIPAILFFNSLFAQDQGINDRLLGTIREYGQAEVSLTVAGPAMLDSLARNVSILNMIGNTADISLSPLTVKWFLKQNYSYSIRQKITPRELITATGVANALTFEAYPTYTQYDSIMQSFALGHPDLCRLDTIGTSVNGRLILALEITGSGGSDENRPEVFYTSTMHGDETAGFVLMLRLADYLLSNYQDNQRVKDLMDNLRIWINPLSNPDGTYNHGDAINNPVRYNANGVDLNRNFPDPLVPGRIQQKENVEMISFLRQHHFVISANFHSGVEVVNYPWDRWLNKYHADDKWFHDISRAYADTVHTHGEIGYMVFMNNGVTRGAVWYVVYGGRQDFVTQELHGREVTIELHDTYVTPATQLATLWEANWRSFLGYLENAMYGIHGKTLDYESEQPVPAEIFIRGHDTDSSQVYADTVSGTFVRMLTPGTWPLTFSASGYRDTTINVTVVAGQRTDITVLMKTGANISDSLPEAPALWPNPATSLVRVLLPEALTGSVEVYITDQSGRLIMANKAEISGQVPYIIDVSALPSGIYQAQFRNIKRNKSCMGRFIVIK